jgi:glycosyltransferase involved in cell wall biosynthesis
MTDATDDEALNVLLLAEDFYPKESGGAFIDWNTAKYLTDAGDRVTVITPRNDGTPSQETVDGVDIRRPSRGIKAETPPNSLRGQLRRILFVLLVIPYLINLIRKEELELVYSTNHLLHPVAALISTIFRLPHVSFVGYSPSIRSNVSLTHPLVLLERMNFRLFMGDYALCQTPSVYEELVRHSDANVERVDGTVDAEAVHSALDSEADSDPGTDTIDKCLIFVGRFAELKNPTKMPTIIARLPSTYSLVMIGDGPQRPAVENAIRKENVQDRVDLTGRLSHEQTLRAIHDTNLLILPSEADAYPTVVFEALALNTPVLATPVGVLPTIDHRNLTIAPLGEFSNCIPDIETAGCRGINEETLRQFSVKRFATSLRDNMIEVMERGPQPDS